MKQMQLRSAYVHAFGEDYAGGVRELVRRVDKLGIPVHNKRTVPFVGSVGQQCTPVLCVELTKTDPASYTILVRTVKMNKDLAVVTDATERRLRPLGYYGGRDPRVDTDDYLDDLS